MINKYDPVFLQKPTRFISEKHTKKIEGSYIQKKYDGQSIQIVCNKNSIRAFANRPSEVAKTFTELTDKIPHIIEELSTLNIEGILQGECISDHLATDELNFKYTVGVLKDHNSYTRQLKEGLVKFVVYDLPSSDKTYKERYSMLQDTFRNLNNKYSSLAPILGINTNGSWESYFNEMTEQNHEGIVLVSPDNYYKRSESTNGRNNLMWKVKIKAEREVLVLEKVPGASNGKFAHTLGALICVDGNDKHFRIGSFAITDTDRDYIWNNAEPPFIVEMRCMSESIDSYRHPIMTRYRPDKDIESWNKVD